MYAACGATHLASQTLRSIVILLEHLIEKLYG